MGIAKIAIVADATSGGKTKDLFTPPALVAGARTWPVTTLQFSRGEKPIERNAEMRGTRAGNQDLSYKVDPSLTVGGILYQPIAKALAFQGLGNAGASTGSGVLGYTTGITTVADSVFTLPASAIHFQREDMANPQVLIGAVLDELEFTFPEEGEATWTAKYVGNYVVEASATAMPALDFTYLGTSDWPLVGRDGKVFERGSGTASAGIKAYSIKWGSQFDDADYDWSANTEDIVLDTVTSRVWWPSGRRLRGLRDITGSVTFRGVDMTRDMRASLRRGGQLKADFSGRAITGTTGPVLELLRIDVANAAFTGGEIAAITRDAKIDSTYQWKSVAPTTGTALTVTVLDGDVGPVTVIG